MVNEPTDELRRSWAGLLRVFEPPEVAVSDYVDRVGAVRAWRAIRDRRAPRPVLSPTAARTERHSAQELEALIDSDLAAAEAVGARLIGPGDPEWPEEAMIAFPMARARGTRNAAAPLALYVRGQPLVHFPHRTLAVVGSRANTSYGQRVAADIAMAAADAGLTVMSGAAFGIDTVAHRAALAYPGPVPDDRSAGLWHRSGVPGRQYRPDPTHCRGGLRDQRIRAWRFAGSAPVSGAEPADRGSVGGHGGGRGGSPLRHPVDGQRRRDAGSGADGRPRSGDLGVVRRVPHVAVHGPGRARHQRGRRARRVGREQRRRQPPGGAGQCVAESRTSHRRAGFRGGQGIRSTSVSGSGDRDRVVHGVRAAGCSRSSPD